MRKVNRKICRLTFSYFLLCIPCVLWFNLFSPAKCQALEPDEILVIANRNVKGSIEIARYYMDKRSIPRANLLKLSVTDREGISREAYDEHVVKKVRKFLKKRDPDHHIRCLVTVYGMPLKIDPPSMSLVEKAELEIMQKRQAVLRERLKELDESAAEEKDRIAEELSGIEKDHDVLRKFDQRSSLDSELCLLRAGAYELSGWLPNPYFFGFQNQKLNISKKKVLWVSRLDGPTPDIVKRIIDDSIAAEKAGLSGTAYFDARWYKPSEAKKVYGYTLYDKSIHKAAKQVEERSTVPVVVDSKSALFQPGQCPDAALYCGWYSLARYVGAFEWVKGAVGYHIASSECTTLKKASSQVWCKRMLEEGVAATIGPTSEPYVQAFPLPEIFFSLLIDGRPTLVECYMAATPFISWQMVLVGDPLYRPFKSEN